jgi:hypothetical protein
MGSVCWNFPLLGTGSLGGSNDAAITMFKGSGIMDGLAREVCQNSLDARDEDVPAEEPVKVQFKLFELERDSFSMFEEFEQALQGAYDYWNNSPVKTKKIIDFLDTVSKYLKMEKIPVLIMSDYNTIGLNGVKPSPGETSYWELLVNTEGISIKQNQNSAGSFGIGKNAPFAYSGLSTVFYNTLAKDGGRAFEGVTHLVTTQRDYKGEMRPTHPSGKYLYLEDEYTGRPILPEDNCDLAKVDEFNRTETGTDVAIFGFKTEEYEKWEEAVAIAVLKNFILAIKDGKLEVEIKSPTKHYIVSKNHLEELLYKRFEDTVPLKWTRQIYETVTETEPQNATIAEKDDLSIYVRYDDGYSAALSRFRSTGMLINTTTESLPHYSVVIIVNDVGGMTLSKTLREAEPPQHTEWKAKNITDNRTLHNLAAGYIRNITKAVQKVLDESERADITDRMDAGIGNYLPDASEGVSEEGTDGLRTDVKISKISSYEGRVFYNNQYESASSDAGSETQKSGIKTGKKKRKKRQKNKIPVVTPTDKGGKGVSPGAGKVKISSLSLSDHRTFYMAGNKYHMFINAPKGYDKVYIQFYAGRDDDKQDAVSIKNVKVEGMPLMEVHGEKIGPIPIKEGGNDLYIEFENNEIMAVIPVFTMEVT